MKIKINKTYIAENLPTYFIADIGANHDGSLKRAKKLIKLCSKVGANAAKFQHFKAETIVSNLGFKSLKIKTHQSNIYLVNTGWIGGPYGVGERISIQKTRACINSILDGSVSNVESKKHKIFNFEVPVYLPGVEHKICNPKASWENPQEYDEQAKKLAEMFQNNFVQYTGEGLTDYTKYGPIIPSKL